MKSLIIDDEPLTCLGYKVFLDKWGKKEGLEEVTTITAYTLKEGIDIFLKNPDFFDLIILDIRMPSYAEERLFSGEDLGLRIKAIRPDIKIIVHTSLNDDRHLYTIFKSLDPDGLLIKSDLDEKIFIHAVKTVLGGQTFYTRSFDELLRKQFASDFVMDDKNREILYLLSTGIKVKDLPEKVHLTLSAVEKRLRLLKQHFNLEGSSLIELLHVARKKGFL